MSTKIVVIHFHPSQEPSITITRSNAAHHSDLDPPYTSLEPSTPGYSALRRWIKALVYVPEGYKRMQHIWGPPGTSLLGVLEQHALLYDAKRWQGLGSPFDVLKRRFDAHLAEYDRLMTVLDQCNMYKADLFVSLDHVFSIQEARVAAIQKEDPDMAAYRGLTDMEEQALQIRPIIVAALDRSVLALLDNGVRIINYMEVGNWVRLVTRVYNNKVTEMDLSEYSLMWLGGRNKGFRDMGVEVGIRLPEVAMLGLRRRVPGPGFRGNSVGWWPWNAMYLFVVRAYGHRSMTSIHSHKQDFRGF